MGLHDLAPHAFNCRIKQPDSESADKISIPAAIRTGIKVGSIMVAMTLSQVEEEIRGLQARADSLRAKRDAAIIAAHTFTADDYRVVVSHDDTYVDSFEDIWGCSDPAEIDDPDSEYSEWREAFENGDGIWAFNVCLERRNPANGEYETIDACGGFYGLTPSISKDTRDAMAEHMSSELPDGININDIEWMDG